MLHAGIAFNEWPLFIQSDLSSPVFLILLYLISRRTMSPCKSMQRDKTSQNNTIFPRMVFFHCLVECVLDSFLTFILYKKDYTTHRNDSELNLSLLIPAFDFLKTQQLSKSSQTEITLGVVNFITVIGLSGIQFDL